MHHHHHRHDSYHHHLCPHHMYDHHHRCMRCICPSSDLLSFLHLSFPFLLYNPIISRGKCLVKIHSRAHFPACICVRDTEFCSVPYYYSSLYLMQAMCVHVSEKRAKKGWKDMLTEKKEKKRQKKSTNFQLRKERQKRDQRSTS